MTTNETTGTMLTLMGSKVPAINNATAAGILKSPIVQEYVRYQIDLAITRALATSPPEAP